MSGYFITFEGSEGCGKTTQINALAKRLREKGKIVQITREPGGTLIGEKIRNLLQDPTHEDKISALTELLLFSASRSQLITNVIKPALSRGEIVISDRFIDSTLVYQGLGRNIGLKIVQEINKIVVDSIEPNLTILLDIDAEIGIKRAKNRQNGQLDRIEKESLSFFQLIRDGYLNLAKNSHGRIKVIDGLLTMEQIENRIWEIIKNQI